MSVHSGTLLHQLRENKREVLVYEADSLTLFCPGKFLLAKERKTLEASVMATRATELTRGLDNTDLFRHCNSDPLVEGHTILFGEALRGLFDGQRKLQRIPSLAHCFTFPSMSPGRTMGIPNRSPADRKSVTLYVTKASALPLIATSSTISSLGSLV